MLNTLWNVLLLEPYLLLDATQHPIHSLVVSAIQQTRTANPHGACHYSWCGVKHDPLCCCICFGTNHKTPDCWHQERAISQSKERPDSLTPTF